MKAASRRTDDGRAAAIRRIGDLGREESARSVMFLQAVAGRLGLSATELKCLDLAMRAGPGEPLTAGRLARLTGLTTGAITGVVDRLEAGGFVRRERDPRDRRRVIVRLLPRREAELAPLFSSLGRAMAELCGRYRQKELALIEDFMARTIRVLHEETLRLRPTNGRRKSKVEGRK